MCGRRAFNLTWPELYNLLEHGIFPERYEREMSPNFNVAPGQLHPIINAAADGRRQLTLSNWGFTPVWWSKPEAPKHTINARAETIATSNMFRGALKSDRCIVPASGYYEWQLLPDGSKRPHYIYRADAAPLLLAGIHAARGECDSYAIITTSAPTGMGQIHDRSPVVVEPEDIARWLDPATPAAAVERMLHPAPDGVFDCHVVGKAVGNVRNNGPELIHPATP